MPSSPRPRSRVGAVAISGAGAGFAGSRWMPGRVFLTTSTSIGVSRVTYNKRVSHLYALRGRAAVAISCCFLFLILFLCKRFQSTACGRNRRGFDCYWEDRYDNKLLSHLYSDYF